MTSLVPAAAVAQEVNAVGGTAPWATFVQSFGIIFREGIEALLICGALAAAALRSWGPGGARVIWRGACAALVASLATAFLVGRILHLAPAGREAIEGVTMILAAAVLFYVSYWLLSKLHMARWLGYLQERVAGARSRWALATVAFFAVYREGVETVLFYEALSSVGAALPIWGGFATGMLALVALGVAMVRFGFRLPVRPLFAITGMLLYALAIVFTGQGVHELQEAGWISATSVAGVPRASALGIYPTLETLAAQGLLVAFAIVAGAVLSRRRRRSRQASEEEPRPTSQALEETAVR